MNRRQSLLTMLAALVTLSSLPILAMLEITPPEKIPVQENFDELFKQMTKMPELPVYERKKKVKPEIFLIEEDFPVTEIKEEDFPVIEEKEFPVIEVFTFKELSQKITDLYENNIKVLQTKIGIKKPKGAQPEIDIDTAGLYKTDVFEKLKKIMEASKELAEPNAKKIESMVKIAQNKINQALEILKANWSNYNLISVFLKPLEEMKKSKTAEQLIKRAKSLQTMLKSKKSELTKQGLKNEMSNQYKQAYVIGANSILKKLALEAEILISNITTTELTRNVPDKKFNNILNQLDMIKTKKVKEYFLYYRERFEFENIIRLILLEAAEKKEILKKIAYIDELIVPMIREQLKDFASLELTDKDLKKKISGLDSYYKKLFADIVEQLFEAAKPKIDQLIVKKKYDRANDMLNQIKNIVRYNQELLAVERMQKILDSIKKYKEKLEKLKRLALQKIIWPKVK